MQISYGILAGNSQSNYAAQGHAANAMAAPGPRTISSAIGRIEGLNERLSLLAKQLAGISDQIGGPRPAETGQIKGLPDASSAVSRLNDSADAAYAQLSEIESLVASISRALG